MMKIIKIFLALSFFLNSTILSVEIFTAIHCDPCEPYNFPLLETLVDSAEYYNVTLTLQFTPQWADSILTIPQRKNLLKIWQSHGHEIALHHHGLGARNYWDGYTNTPDPDSILQAGHNPDSLKGSMEEFYNLLKFISGDSLILTFGCGDTTDWIDGIPFQNDGNLVEHTGLPMTTHNYNGNIVKRIGQVYLGTNKTLEDLQFLYQKNIANDTLAIGAVFHVHNFASSQELYMNWFKFLKDKKNNNVRQICRFLENFTPIKESYHQSRINLPIVFPNPLRTKHLLITLNDLNNSNILISIFDILGRKKFSQNLPLNTNHFILDLAHLTNGFYIINFKTSKHLITKKITICR